MALKAPLWIALFVALFCTNNPSASLQTKLKATYHQKVMFLRGFYLDGELHFDSKGTVIGRVHPGSWTLSGIELQQEKVSSGRVEFWGPRVAEKYDKKTKKFSPQLCGRGMHIVVDRDPSLSDAAVLGAISHIFIARSNELGSLIPTYWRPVVLGEIESVPQRKGKDCQRVKGLLHRTGDGGVSLECEQDAKTATAAPPAADTSRLGYRAGDGVAEPKVLSAPSPDYEPLAAANRISGTVLLQMEVDARGSPGDIILLQPVGFGLDERAVAAVQTWKFNPATLHGQPVPVWLTVHLKFSQFR